MTTQPLDPATCHAIIQHLLDVGLGPVGAAEEVKIMMRKAGQQQPEPTPAAPSAGAMLAAEALDNAWDYDTPQESMARIIDRETRLPQLGAALQGLYLLMQHETNLPRCAANGVVSNGGDDEGVRRAGMIIEEARAALTQHDHGPKPATTERKTDAEPRTPDGNRPDSDTTRTPSRESTGPGTPPRVYPEFPCSGQ